MDLHRRRSVLVRMSETGDLLETVRLSNDPEYLRQVLARAGEAPEVVLEATYGWYSGGGHARRAQRACGCGVSAGSEGVLVSMGEQRPA